MTPGRRLANAAAPHARHTGGRTSAAARAGQGAVVGQRRPRPRSARTGPASGSCGRPGSGPARACCARTRPSGRVAQVGDQRRRDERRLPRLVAPAVDDLDDRPAGALVVDRRPPQPAPDSGQRRLTVGHGDTSSTGDARRGGPARRRRRGRATSGCAPPAAPRRARRRRRPRPGRGHGAHAAARAPMTTSTPAAAAAHSCGTSATVSPARRSRVASSRAAVDRRHHDQRRPERDRGGEHRADVVGRWEAQHAAAGARAGRPRPACDRLDGDAGPPRRAAGRPTLVGGLAVTRNGRSRPAAPAHRRPAGQVDQLGRRTARADLGDRPQASAAGASGGSSSTTQPPTRRPCSGTRTSEPTCTTARPSRRGRGSRTPCRAR